MTTRFTSRRAVSAAALILFLCGLWFKATTDSESRSEAGRDVSQDHAGPSALLAPVSLEESYPHQIEPQSTLYSVLRELNIAAPTIHAIVTAAKPVIDLGRLRPGTRFRLIPHARALGVSEGSGGAPGTLGTFGKFGTPGTSKISGIPRVLADPKARETHQELGGIRFWISPIEKVEIRKVDETWVAEKIIEPVETRVVTFRGLVETTLWESAEKVQMDPNLIVELAEIFAWQVDFAREVRPQDRWRLSVEQKWVKGQPIGWGAILAAEYENAGELHNAVLFRPNGESKGYFAMDGTSLRRMFLKSPIRYGRISSRFTRRRFHPVLKVNRPHLGVDYAAPIGTPVRAVGSGTITHAGWLGGGGRTVKIRHNSVYNTAYLHLSRFAAGVRPGSRVEQGQVIGFVGTTGLSTGPHLHFEFKQNGRVVDPLGHKFPSADPVPAQDMAQFKEDARSLLRSLPDWENLVSMREPASLPAARREKAGEPL